MDRGILFVSIPKEEVALRIPVSAGNLDTHFNGKTRVTKQQEMRSNKELSIK
jgi:hypothetical protein